EIIYPEKQLANWAAIRYSSDHIFDYIELDELNAIFEVSTPLDWVGKSIQEIDIRKKFKINILAIKENGKINSNVTPDLVLDENKNLLVLGEHKQVQKCFNI
ncbi:MAG: TrkA family potassium uptake protein, partial [Clostridia bacterium]|nr:TrkA family potassium uptake protein [Clostridia bacterium]